MALVHTKFILECRLELKPCDLNDFSTAADLSRLKVKISTSTDIRDIVPKLGQVQLLPRRVQHVRAFAEPQKTILIAEGPSATMQLCIPQIPITHDGIALSFSRSVAAIESEGSPRSNEHAGYPLSECSSRRIVQTHLEVSRGNGGPAEVFGR